MPSVREYKKKDGTSSFFVRIEYPRDYVTDGRQRKELKAEGAKTRQEAINWGRDKEYEIRHGLFSSSDSITFRRYAEEYILITGAEKNWAESTFISYRSNFQNHVYPIIGNVDLEDVDTNMCRAIINRVKENYSGNHKSRMQEDGSIRENSTTLQGLVYAYIHAVFNKAIVDRKILFHPMAPMKKPAKSDFESKAMNLQEMGVFINLFKDHWLYEAYMIALTTAFRRGEVMALRWRDIDLDLLTVSALYTINPKIEIKRISRGKGGDKTMSIAPDTGAMMRRYKQIQRDLRVPEGFPFTGDTLVWSELDGTPINPKRFSNEFTRKTKDTILEGFRPHEIRHTTGTYIVAKTGNTKLASEVLGHSSVAFTADTYVKPISDDKRRVAEDLQDVIRDALQNTVDEDSDSVNIEPTQNTKK